MNFLSAAAIFASIVGFINASESCIQCNSVNDQKCNINALSITPQDCPTNTSHCYTKIMNGNVIRGCTGDTNVPTLDLCQTDALCQPCIGVNNRGGCNNEVYPHHRLACHICKGNLDSDCGSESKEGASVVCPVYEDNDRCFIRRTHKEIERGCVSSNNKLCEDINHCLICAGHGCNNMAHKNEEIPLAPGGSAATTTSASFIVSVLLFIGARIASQ